MGDFNGPVEMMRWRRVHYDMRSKLLLPLNKHPENFGPAKVDIQLTGGKQDGSSIWNSGDEDMMIILDRYVCVDEKHIDQHKEDTEHVYFQIEEVQSSPGYVYLKKCPLTKLDIDNSAIDRLVSTSLNENGYLSSQKWNTIIYENCKTSEEQVKEQVKGLVKIGMITDKAVTDFFSYQWFHTENDDYPNIILRYEGFGKNFIDLLYGAFNCVQTKGHLEAWAKRQRRHDWPSSAVIDKVLKMPVHIVPKGCKGSETRAVEFRLSYVLSEIALTQSLNDTQGKLYSLLKLLVKSTVDKRFPDILTSYCLKNVVFWICEGNPQQMFDNGSLLELLELCLQFIRDIIKDERLSMYIMPERNLLEGKINDGNKMELLALITDHISKLETVVFDTFPSIKRITEDVIRKDPVHCIALGVLLHKGEMWLVGDRMKTFKDHAVIFGQFMSIFNKKLQDKSNVVKIS